MRAGGGGPADAVTVVSWNVLADAYVRPSYYPHTPRSFLEPEPRRARVLERLRAFEADVLCLQEADEALFGLAQASLPGVGRLLKKPGRVEGCAIFVSSARAAEATWRELVDPSDATPRVALAVELPGLVVVTTHLQWEPPGTPPEVHRGLAHLKEISRAFGPSDGPRVVCGDLNAEPGSLVLSAAAAQGLLDAYGSEPEAFTCNSNGARKRIDFILHSADLDAEPLALPPIEDTTPLPGPAEPSDHLPIAARLVRRS